MHGELLRAYKALNDAQKRAVDTIDGPVLVIAGPGTGKTQLLTVRVANILSQAAVLPQNILCLTFTESGQQAMRERLTKFIGPDAYAVTISTYHAFGNELIRRYPEYTDASLGQRPIDALLLDEILRSVQAAIPYANPLKSTAAYLEDLKTLISDAKRALLWPADLRTIAKANQIFVNAASAIVQQHLGGLKAISKSAMPLFAAILEELQKIPISNVGVDNIQPLQIICVTELSAALEEFADTTKTTSVTKWKNNWLGKDSKNHFVLTGERTHKRLLAAADIYEKYEAELESRGVFDYDDMIGRAVRALEQNDDFKFTLQEQYQYILLDEYQDTNAAQARLIELLTDNPVNEGRPNVLAVGDDDQAIYAFQGASYSNMRKFVDAYQDVVKVPLTHNYRSHPDILHVATNVAQQIGERLHTTMEDVRKELIAAGKNLSDSDCIERHDMQTDVSEFAWVAREIQKLIKKGTPAAEIAVLAPRHRWLEQLVPYLQSLEIPVQYEKRENILDDRFIIELTTMARLAAALAAQDETTADSLWPTVLSYGCWNLPTALIWETSWEARTNRTPWRTAMMQHEQLRPIALFFTKVAMQSASETLEEIIDYLVGRTYIELEGEGGGKYISPFYECYFGSDIRDQRAGDFMLVLSHFMVLRQRLKEYKADQDRALRLEDYISFVNAHLSANIKIMGTTPLSERSDAVQLMTAYKSKGLEFDAVFVLACQDEVWGSKARSMSSNISLPANLQYIRYAGANEDERLRLFFVAVSRARHQLFLTSHRASYAGKHTTRLKYLLEQEGENGEFTSSVLPPHASLVHSSTANAPASLEDLYMYWHSRHVEGVKQPALRDLLEPKLQNYLMSASHLTTFVDVRYGGPEAFFLSAILHFPQAATIDIHYGTSFHETMEWLHIQLVASGNLPTTPEAIDYFGKALLKKRLSPHDTQLLIERGTNALTAYLQARSDTFLPTDKHEFNFRSEGIVLDSMHLTGKIDKLILDPKAKTATIVDYKTGKGFDVWKGGEPKLHNYRLQLYFYKLLVERSRTFAGYRVDQGQLEFVEPDENGHINTLTIDFSGKEMEETKQLMRAVWAHVKDLNLPDISDYEATLKGIKAFEEDLRSGSI